MNRKGIYYPIVGLISIIAVVVVANSSTGLNVHSGEIFIWILIMLILGIIIPLVSFLKSLEIVRFKLGEEKSNIKTYSIILTYLLGAMLAGLMTFVLKILLQ